MKKVGVLCGAFCLFIYMAVPAFATTWNEYDSYWVVFNFSGTTDFEGAQKTVSSVFAHTGVLRDGGDACGQTFGAMQPGDWQNETNISMPRVGDHFFGKAEIDGSTGECQIGVKGLIVEYWVTYTDGSTMITTPALVDNVTDASITIQSDEDWNTAKAALDKRLDGMSDAPATSATRLHYQWAD